MRVARLIIWISLAFALLPAWANYPGESWWCIDDPPTADKKQMNCLKSLDASQAMRKDFDEIARKRQVCPNCKLEISEGENYIPKFHLSFKVIQATDGKMGGVHLSFVFKDNPMNEFDAWMDFVEESFYKLKYVREVESDKITLATLRKLRGKEFEPFWIESK